MVDLDQLQGLNASHPIYREHDKSRILGQGVTTRNGNKLVTAGSLTNESDDVTEVVRLGKRKFPFESSVGIQPIAMMRVEPNQKVTVNGTEFTGPFMLARPQGCER